MAAVIWALLPLLGGALRLDAAVDYVGVGSRLPLLPYPADVKLGAEGAAPFELKPGATISTGDGLVEDDPAVVALRGLLAKVSGEGSQGGGSTDGAGGGTISLNLKGKASAGSTAEQGYHLTITDKAVALEAPTKEGLFYGVQTLRQLVSRKEGAAAASLPSVAISDAPRFVWRGLHLDVSRHFWTAAQVKTLLDTMSLFKLNRFHWHLTDDQGWRLPVEGYPRLTEVGGRGNAYTRGEIQDVVAFAQARHIDVIPEIDVPGHVEAALAAYPDLGNSDIEDWRAPSEPRAVWGVSDYTLAPSNATWTFLQKVFDTVAEVFPSRIVHMGGDEVRTGQWARSSAAKSYMSLLESAPPTDKPEEQVSRLFSGKVVELLKARGRRVAAWNEAQHTGNFPGDGIVMAWTSVSEVVAAVQAGRQAVVADIGVLYFDHIQANKGEPEGRGDCSSWQDVYRYNLMPKELEALPEEKRNLVLGAQGQLWSEYFPTWEHVEYMAHPRSLALAEKTWTPASAIENESEFEGRMRQRLVDLEQRGVKYRKLGGRC